MKDYMIQIKICGITRLKDALQAVKLGVNALGFILADSPRRVYLQDVRRITAFLPPFISRVAVVVNPADIELEEIVKSRLFDYIQFHGTEDPQIITHTPLKTIKAISIADRSDLEKISKYSDSNYYLFDTKINNQSGGTGKTFNWQLLNNISINKPFILAGGLGPDNIISALKTVKPAAVDLNSRIEKYAGIKDHNLLAETILKIKKIELGGE